MMVLLHPCCHDHHYHNFDDCYVVWFSGHKAHLWQSMSIMRGCPCLFRENCKLRQLRAWFYVAHILYIVQQLRADILYVTIEMINYVQASYIDNDLEMYDDEDDVPALVRTSNMNVDLGMIAHIFSDKTGTLTREHHGVQGVRLRRSDLRERCYVER